VPLLKARVTFSLVVAIVLSLAGLLLTERRGDPASVIFEAETQLAAAFQPRALRTPTSLKGKISSIVQIAPAWSEVQSIASQLTWQNR